MPTCSSLSRRDGLVMEFCNFDTAVVFIDPQIDVLSPDGKN